MHLFVSGCTFRASNPQILFFNFQRIFPHLPHHTNHEVIKMINNDELPIGFTMELAMHSDALNRFAGLPKQEQERIVNGARTIESRQEMRNYVEHMFMKG